MIEQDSYVSAFDKLGSFANELYDDADPTVQKELPKEESSPLYEALTHIDERYQEALLIGKGGMKEVYKVYDLRAARYVALAKPKKELIRADYDAFLREAHITARLAHPGIINLYNIGIDKQGSPFFTMEFKRGRSLREVLRDLNAEKDLISAPVPKRLNIFLRVCEAIAYAHSRRVLHLDIKPENIQVGPLGEVQVCDWGMGVVLSSQDGETKDSHDMDDREITLDPDLYGPLLIRTSGTLGYMAPEQTKPREPKTAAMDIYALGCVLEELLTLKFTSPKTISSEINDNVLKAIIEKARHKNSHCRYESVEALHLDISRYLSGYSTTVEQAGFFRETSLFVRRNLVPSFITLSLLLILVVGTGIFINQLRDSRTVAETSLQKYLDEKEASEEQLVKNANEALYLARRMSEPVYYTDQQVFKEALEESERQLIFVLSQNPPRDSISWGKLIWVYFIKQDFKSALKVLERNPTPPNIVALIPYVKEYAHLVNDKGHFPVEVLIQLLHKFKNGTAFQPKSLIERIVFYDLYHERPTEEYLMIIRALLEINNPTCPEIDFSYDANNRAITIKGQRLHRLRVKVKTTPNSISFLKILDPLKLTLTGSHTRNMQELNGLQLLELDLRGVKTLENLDLLNEMRSLRKITVFKNQLNDSQKKSLADFIELVEL
ncbi:MAG: serine/threonine protein kinase [Lentisphaeraceae bacterium]|nr:serine/threonine protein kinase [Lentisphaeraceae bacterium]